MGPSPKYKGALAPEPPIMRYAHVVSITVLFSVLLVFSEPANVNMNKVTVVTFKTCRLQGFTLLMK